MRNNVVIGMVLTLCAIAGAAPATRPATQPARFEESVEGKAALSDLQAAREIYSASLIPVEKAVAQTAEYKAADVALKAAEERLARAREGGSIEEKTEAINAVGAARKKLDDLRLAAVAKDEDCAGAQRQVQKAVAGVTAARGAWEKQQAAARVADRLAQKADLESKAKKIHPVMQIGMTIEEVAKALGGPGKLQNERELRGKISETYVWSPKKLGEHGADASFHGGALVFYMWHVRDEDVPSAGKRLSFNLGCTLPEANALAGVDGFVSSESGTPGKPESLSQQVMWHDPDGRVTAIFNGGKLHSISRN